MMRLILRLWVLACVLSLGNQAVAQVNSQDSPEIVLAIYSNPADGCFTNAQAVYNAVSSELTQMGFILVDEKTVDDYDFALRIHVTTYPIEETGQCVAATFKSTDRPMTVDGIEGKFSVNTTNSLTLGSGNLNAPVQRIVSEYVAAIFSSER